MSIDGARDLEDVRDTAWRKLAGDADYRTARQINERIQRLARR
jgi:hypothetical protein